MTDTKRILEFLMQEKDICGEKAVHEAYRLFKRQAKKNFKEPTKRKAMPKAWLKRAYDRQEGYCARRGEFVDLKDATADHIVALNLGGEHSEDNIQMCCRRCNSEKNAKSLFQDAKRLNRTITKWASVK